MFKDSYFPLIVCSCMTFPLEVVCRRKHQTILIPLGKSSKTHIRQALYCPAKAAWGKERSGLQSPLFSPRLCMSVQSAGFRFFKIRRCLVLQNIEQEPVWYKP